MSRFFATNNQRANTFGFESTGFGISSCEQEQRNRTGDRNLQIAPGGVMLGHASLMRPIDRSRHAVRELSRYAAARTFAAAVTAATCAGGVMASPSFPANGLLLAL
jgi:hypothetical protein